MNVSPFIEAENARDADVPSTQVAEWAGHSVAVLHRIYAKILAGQEASARERIERALR